MYGPLVIQEPRPGRRRSLARRHLGLRQPVMRGLSTSGPSADGSPGEVAGRRRVSAALSCFARSSSQGNTIAVRSGIARSIPVRVSSAVPKPLSGVGVPLLRRPYPAHPIRRPSTVDEQGEQFATSRLAGGLRSKLQAGRYRGRSSPLLECWTVKNAMPHHSAATRRGHW